MLHIYNTYELIHYYTKKYQEIKNSIHQRNHIDNTAEIDKLIQELKHHNNQFAETCKNIKNEHDVEKRKELKNKKSNIGAQINKLGKEIKIKITQLPNTLNEKVEKYDKPIKEIKNNNNSNGKKFIDIVNNECIKSSNRNLILSNRLSEKFYELLNKCIEHNKSNGFQIIYTPSIIKTDSAQQSMHYNLFKDNLYSINKSEILIPTGECQLVQYANHIKESEITDEEKIIRLQTVNSCFRNEDSTTSKTNKPMIRQSEFTKVETFTICHAKNSESQIQFMMNNICALLNNLKINYKIIQVGATEMGPLSHIQYDINCFLPNSNMEIEIVSLSNCLNIQSTHKNENICYINGTCLAINRLLCVIIEQGLMNLE